MRNLIGFLMISVLLMVSGCAYIAAPDGTSSLGGIQNQLLKPIEQKLDTDVIVSGQVGTIVNRPEIVQCSAYLKTLIEGLNATNDQIAQLQALDTRGLVIASTLKDYFIANLSLSGAQAAQADFEKNFPIQCGAVQSVVSMQVFRALLAGFTRGGAGGLGLPGGATPPTVPPVVVPPKP